MIYRYTRIWKIQHKLVVADTIEEAIELYKHWVISIDKTAKIDITTITAISDDEVPKRYDALIQSRI